MNRFQCDICKEEIEGDRYDAHLKSHLPNGPIAVEKMSPDDSNFIPEIEKDENGRKRHTQYQQKPYKPLTEFEG